MRGIAFSVLKAPSKLIGAFRQFLPIVGMTQTPWHLLHVP